ncbi:MAG: hypothetical protein ACOCWH_00765 [Spirochaetota bacterium]
MRSSEKILRIFTEALRDYELFVNSLMKTLPTVVSVFDMGKGIH